MQSLIIFQLIQKWVTLIDVGRTLNVKCVLESADAHYIIIIHKIRMVSVTCGPILQLMAKMLRFHVTHKI